jgi:hypothetical protein
MMEAIVLAAHYQKYLSLCQQYQLYRTELKYATDWMELRGYHWDTPIIILEGYEHNLNYTLEFMRKLGHRFDNIGFLSEGERWANYPVDVQHYTQYEVKE